MDYLVDEVAEQLNEETRNARGRLPGDENLTVRFKKTAVPNKTKSEAEGRPIYDERDFIEIKSSSDAYFVINTYAREEHKVRFPNEWQAFLNKVEGSMNGTPLDKWNGISAARIAELRSFNVFTVEALAELSDAQSSRFQGIVALKKKAQAFLDATKEEAIANKSAETSAKLAELEKDKNEAKAQAEMQKQELAELRAMVKAMTKGAEEAPAKTK